MRHLSSEDDTCFSVDVTNDVISECMQGILQNPLDALLEKAKDTIQNMEVMAFFEKDTLLLPPMWKERKRGQHKFRASAASIKDSIASNTRRITFLMRSSQLLNYYLLGM